MFHGNLFLGPTLVLGTPSTRTRAAASCLDSHCRSGLSSCDALVHEDFHFYATILGPSSRALVGRSRLEFSHRAWRHDAPHRNVALPNQVTDNCFGAIFA